MTMVLFAKGIATRHEKHKEYRKYTFLDSLKDLEEFQKDIVKESKHGTSEQQIIVIYNN